MINLAFISPTKHLNLSAKGDFDFCLAHILLKDKTYQNYFKKQKQKGRMIICDPSVHEKEKINEEEVIDYVLNNDVCTHYVIYDQMFDMKRTKENVINFIKKYKKRFTEKKIKLIGVVQGKNIQECLEMFDYLNENKDIGVIGVSFDYSFIIADEHINTNQMFSRVYYLWKVATTINVKKPVHVLGLNSPFELALMKQFDFIKTNDTKLPIRCALNNMKFNTKFGSINKPPRKMLFEDSLNKKQLDIANHNIKIMKQFAK